MAMSSFPIEISTWEDTLDHFESIFTDSDGEEQFEGDVKRLKTEHVSTTLREVSDDDVNSHSEMKQPGSLRSRANQKINMALQEQRIDKKKAERLRECLQVGDLAEVAFRLLCEQIPEKRKGEGYSCRVCQVHKKGHMCTYCHICSTPEKKYKKDDKHTCVNCPTCFEVGKKNKKTIQVQCEGHVCPY